METAKTFGKKRILTRARATDEDRNLARTMFIERSASSLVTKC